MTDIRSGSMIPSEPPVPVPTSPETTPSQGPAQIEEQSAQPQQGVQQPGTPAPAQPAAPQANPKQHLWSAVMEAMAPHQYQTDPNTGETKTVQAPASFKNMMKGVVASALVGMMAPNGGNPAESFSNGAAMGKARDDEMRRKSIDDAQRKQQTTLFNMNLSRLNQEQLIGAMQLSQHDVAGAQQMATANQPLIDRARDEGTLIQENLSEDEAKQLMQQQYPTTQFRYVVQGVEVSQDKGWTGRPQVHYRLAVIGMPKDGADQLPLSQDTYDQRAAAGMPGYKIGMKIPETAQISKQAEDYAHSYMTTKYGPMKHEFDVMVGTLGKGWKDAAGQGLPTFPTDPITVQSLLKLQTEIVGVRSSAKEETNEGRILVKALDNLAQKNPQAAARAEAALGGSATVSAYAAKLEKDAKAKAATDNPPKTIAEADVALADAKLGGDKDEIREAQARRDAIYATHKEQREADSDLTERREKHLADHKEELGRQGMGTDIFDNPFGVVVTGYDAKGSPREVEYLTKTEYNKRYDSFSKDYMKDKNRLQKANDLFTRIENDPQMNGAEKVTALLTAVGISGNPLRGGGFRINQATIDEHAFARPLYEDAANKANKIAGTGGPITAAQVKSYAKIARGVVKDEYVQAAREATRQGLPIDFLPRGQGQQIDKATAEIYFEVAGKDKQKAMAAAQKMGWKF